MDQRSQITSAIIDAIQEVNQTLPAGRKISTQADAALYGPPSTVDSLTVTLLIVAIEQKLERSMGQVVTLVDYSVGLSPLKSITTLCDYISHLIEKKIYVP
jgi:acyl carrier protein